jgi:hypothetical protein
MKKIILHALFLFLFPLTIFSQRVVFCEKVNSFGKPENESSIFNIGSNGGYFKVLVTLKNKVESKKVVFDIYKIDGKKKSLDNTIKMEVNPALTWFYKEITFYKEGEYQVYVYDEKDKLLGVGNVQVRIR